MRDFKANLLVDLISNIFVRIIFTYKILVQMKDLFGGEKSRTESSLYIPIEDIDFNQLVKGDMHLLNLDPVSNRKNS